MNDRTIRSDYQPEPATPLDELGSPIGPYTLLSKLGEGGFGVVYEAEQQEPIKRRVALKLIKLGMDTREFIARFEAERQALALMDHPHIATVLGAGASADGRPYFVMERVEGEAITSYCARHSLSLGDRLRLFVQVCEAVQHAHGKGIIHRDLKPNNVLVSTHDGRAFAKVIDFGIAKAAGGGASDAAQTAQHVLVGTPAYMSPEQAAGSADIDTRADIYALGVMLYELLAGSTPHDSITLRDAGYFEIQRIIHEVQPPAPSARLRRMALRPAEPQLGSALASGIAFRTVRGELDWIAMKAIEKERDRRYATASELARDVQRYLAGQPVQAAPASRLYRMRKFLQRHAVMTTAVLLAAVSLLVGAAGFAWQARVAQQRATELEQVAAFEEQLFSQMSPSAAGRALQQSVLDKLRLALEHDGLAPADVQSRLAEFESAWRRINATDTARELIDSALLQPSITAIHEQFAEQPLISATLQQLLADRYISFGMAEAALPLQQQALTLRRQYRGDEHPETVDSLHGLAQVLLQTGELEQAEHHLREALSLARKGLGTRDPATLDLLGDLGSVLAMQERYTEAEQVTREALALSREVSGADDRSTLATQNELGLLLLQQGDWQAAERTFRDTLERQTEVLGDEHPDTLSSYHNLGSLLQEMGRLDEAEHYVSSAYEASRRIQGDSHPDTLSSRRNLGMLRLMQQQWALSEQHLTGSWQEQRRILGNDHHDTLITQENLAELMRSTARWQEAADYQRELWRLRRGKLGAEHLESLRARAGLAEILNKLGQHAEVAEWLDDFNTALPQEGDSDVKLALAQVLNEVGLALMAQQQFAKAETALLAAHRYLADSRLADSRPADTRLLDQLVQGTIQLYDRWHRAEPRAGHKTERDKWQAFADANRSSP